MNSAFYQIVFTPSVLAAQEKYNGHSATLAVEALKPNPLGPEEAAFIAERDSFYFATTGETGWP